MLFGAERKIRGADILDIDDLCLAGGYKRRVAVVGANQNQHSVSVSYTHLTLPTILRV